MFVRYYGGEEEVGTRLARSGHADWLELRTKSASRRTCSVVHDDEVTAKFNFLKHTQRLVLQKTTSRSASMVIDNLLSINAGRNWAPDS